MFKEELPALVSLAILLLVFLAAWLQDVRRIRRHLRHSLPTQPPKTHPAAKIKAANSQ